MKVLKVTAQMWYDFVHNIFPFVCINCHTTLMRDEKYICSSCKVNLPRTNNYLVPTNNLYQKFAYERKVTHASSFLDYNKHGIARKLIHALKYQGEQDLGQLLGVIYGTDLLKLHSLNPDMIIPVPLHPNKIKKRGYNQSEMIALGLSESLDVSVETSIAIRNTFTATQTKKSKVSRWQNVGEVFEITRPDLLHGKKVMLVDDVLTTGATIGSLGAKVAACDVKEIYIVAIASGA